MTFDFKKKHKSVKFDSKDMIESYQKENPDLKDSIPIKQKEVDPNLANVSFYNLGTNRNRPIRSCLDVRPNILSQ